MKQEEQEKYSAIVDYNVCGFRMLSRINTPDLFNGDVDKTINYIKDCIESDLNLIKRKLNEIPEVPIDLDSK